MDTDSELVFVYGTLRLGASNHRRMFGAEWFGSAQVAGRLYQVSWYPGMVLEADEGERVVGDVYQVSPEHLRRLDEFEGLPSDGLSGDEYERVRVRAHGFTESDVQMDPPSEGIEVWAWVWKRDTDDLIEVATGDWLDVERPRQAPWYTAVGCVGVLGVPLLGSLIISLLKDLLSMSVSPWVLGVLLMAGGGMSFVVGIMADRRREPGRPFQILMMAVAVLTVFGGMLLLSDLF